jgi:hypothetical protein
MSLPLRVLPGDLITADFMNQVVDALTAFDGRISQLEASTGATGAVAIYATIPAGAVQMGTELRVFGRGFGVPSQTTVTIDAIPVTLKSGSGSSLLIFDVPRTIPGVPASGRVANLQVVAAGGSDSTQIYLVPPATLTGGSLLVTLQMPTASVIQPGVTYLFPCSVLAVTTQDDYYNVTASAAGGGIAWAASILDSGQNPISRLFISKSNPPGTTINFFVQVAIPGGATGGATVSFTIASAGNPQFAGGSGPQPFTVGQAPPPSPTIPLTATVIDQNGNPINVNPGQTLNVPLNQDYQIYFTAQLPAAGTYDVTFQVASGTASWAPSAPTSFTNQGTYPVTATLHALAGAPDTTLTFRLDSRNTSDFGVMSFSIHAS